MKPPFVFNEGLRLAEAEVAIYAEKCAEYARELGRLRERVKHLEENQCGEQVGWCSRQLNLVQRDRPNDCWNPEPVYVRRARE